MIKAYDTALTYLMMALSYALPVAFLGLLGLGRIDTALLCLISFFLLNLNVSTSEEYPEDEQQRDEVP